MTDILCLQFIYSLFIEFGYSKLSIFKVAA